MSSTGYNFNSASRPRSAQYNNINRSKQNSPTPNRQNQQQIAAPQLNTSYGSVSRGRSAERGSHNQQQSQQQQAFPFRGVDEAGRPYVQPTHGLGARGGKALNGGGSYENLGGRMMMRHEHFEHLKRLDKVKPCIDSAVPKSFAERKRQQRIYLARFGMTGPNLDESSNNNNNSDVKQQQQQNNNTSISKTSGSVGRLRSAQRQNRAGSATPLMSRKIGNNSSSSTINQSSGIHEKNAPTHDVFSQLNPEAQSICKATVDVLETLSTSDARALLTQLLREAEEKRLLSAYSGVFPQMQGNNNNNTTSQQHHHQQNQQSQQQPQHNNTSHHRNSRSSSAADDTEEL
jgi:hypothetical protein